MNVAEQCIEAYRTSMRSGKRPTYFVMSQFDLDDLRKEFHPFLVYRRGLSPKHEFMGIEIALRTSHTPGVELF